MERELISVIVPIYDVEKYLDDCISSIVNQTYKNLEIILVDDGSPDNCPQICDEWAKKDSRIKVIHKENGGVSSARNAGLDAATGDYIGFVDGDDMISDDFYEILLDSAIKYNCEVSACGFMFLKSDLSLSEKSRSYLDSLHIFSHDELLQEYFSSCKGEWVSFCNKIIKHSLFDGLRFPMGRVFEDWTLAPMVYDNCSKACYVPVKKYKYVIHDASIVRTQDLKTFADCVSADYDHYCFFNEKGINNYNDNIKSFITADFRKCIKAYNHSEENHKLLSDSYKKAKEIAPSTLLDFMYRFPNFFVFLYKLRGKIKR